MIVNVPAILGGEVARYLDSSDLSDIRARVRALAPKMLASSAALRTQWAWELLEQPVYRSVSGTRMVIKSQSRLNKPLLEQHMCSLRITRIHYLQSKSFVYAPVFVPECQMPRVSSPKTYITV